MKGPCSKYTPCQWNQWLFWNGIPMWAAMKHVNDQCNSQTNHARTQGSRVKLKETVGANVQANLIPKKERELKEAIKFIAPEW